MRKIIAFQRRAEYLGLVTSGAIPRKRDAGETGFADGGIINE
jgi:hypothetical protein